MADKPLNQFDVWYVESTNGGTPVTKEAHDYDELYRYDGQIYEFLVHDVLKYNGHKVLAQTAMDLAKKHNLNTPNTVIVDIGAGHGSDLQELRKKGFKGKVLALEISKAAKAAHDTPHEYYYLKYRYDNYYCESARTDQKTRQAITEAKPQLLIVGSVTPINMAMKDVASTIQCLAEKSHVVINMADKNDSNDKMYDYLALLETNGVLSKTSNQQYFHRTHMNGENFYYNLYTYKLLKPLPENLLLTS